MACDEIVEWGKNLGLANAQCFCWSFTSIYLFIKPTDLPFVWYSGIKIIRLTIYVLINYVRKLIKLYKVFEMSLYV